MTRKTSATLRGRIWQEGIPHWWRGPATLDGDQVVLDVRKARTFQPATEQFEKKPFLRALPYQVTRIKTPADVRWFVETCGPLVTPPGADVCREPVASYLEIGHQVASILRIVQAVRRAHDGNPAAARALTETWQPLVTPFVPAPAQSQEELIQQLWWFVSQLVNRGLGSARVGLVPQFSPAPRFHFAVVYGTLLSSLFTSLAEQVSHETPIDVRTCDNPTCGNLFLPNDARSHFCSPRCSNQLRQRRKRGQA